MISYAVCVWRDDLYRAHCLPALERQRSLYGAEIIEVRSTVGLADAYEQARTLARYGTVVYLHDDLEIVDPDASRRIADHLAAHPGVCGVVGSASGEVAIPWWEAGRYVGGWRRPSPASDDQIIFSIGDALQTLPYDGVRRPMQPDRALPAALLDGILLADSTGLPWEQEPGWHGYDVNRCRQAAQEGFEVWAIDLEVRHHGGQGKTAAWRDAMEPTWARLRDKWGGVPAGAGL